VNDDLMLAIETSSARGSIALGRAAAGAPLGAGAPPVAPGSGGQALASHALAADRRHAAELLPAIRDLLNGAGCGPRDVGIVCFSRGPGSFTGLRVAATIARLWQSATGCQVVAADTLEVIARNALAHPERPERIAAVLDAKRGQVFGAVFEREGDGELRTVSAAGRHEAAAWLAALPRPCVVLGEGAAAHPDAIFAAGLPILDDGCWWPDARQTLAVGWRRARAGQFCKPEEIVPLYLRPPECEEVYEQRRAAARQRRGM
jgi:tRNA threonylcarbamoyladenosine biosynthesis protein TsaB